MLQRSWGQFSKVMSNSIVFSDDFFSTTADLYNSQKIVHAHCFAFVEGHRYGRSV